MSTARPDLSTKRWQSAYWYRRPRHGALSIEQWYDQEVHHHMAATKHEESRRYLRPVQWALLAFVLVSMVPMYLINYRGPAFVSSATLQPTGDTAQVRAHFAVLTYTETIVDGGQADWWQDTIGFASCTYWTPEWAPNTPRQWSVPGCAALNVMRVSGYIAPLLSGMLISVAMHLGIVGVLLAALMRARYETDILSFGNEPTVTADFSSFPILHFDPLIDRPARTQPTPAPNPPPRTPMPPAAALTAHYLSYQRAHLAAYHRRLRTLSGCVVCVVAMYGVLAVSCGVWVTDGGFVDREVGWPAWVVMGWSAVCATVTTWMLVAVRRLHGALVEHVENVTAMVADEPALYQHVKPSVGMAQLGTPLMSHETVQ